MLAKQKLSPIIALLTGAVVWGLIWYPYRFLEAAGVSGALATCITYGIALVIAMALFHRELRAWRRRSRGWPVLAAIALAAGGANLGYVLGTLHGEVMQVLLLFYLAPLWTVLLARALLNEKPGTQGYLVIGLAFAGAVVMLWRPHAVLPLPRDAADWMGLSAGVMFALFNVLSRKSEEHSIVVKSASVFVGVALLSLLLVIFAPPEPAALPQTSAALSVTMLLLLGVVIFAVNIVVQHGLAHTPANQAIVIFLFELVVGALSSYFLAQETMTARQWAGGAMIVAASLFSGKLGERSVVGKSGRQLDDATP